MPASCERSPEFRRTSVQPARHRLRSGPLESCRRSGARPRPQGQALPTGPHDQPYAIRRPGFADKPIRTAPR